MMGASKNRTLGVLSSNESERLMFAQEKRRIVMLVYDRPNYHGGPNVNARRLLPELRRRGHHPTALILYEGGEEPSSAGYFEREGVECRIFPWQPYVTPMVRWILQQLRELEPDIFIPNSYVCGFFASRWAREAGIATIAVLRSSDVYHWGLVHEFVVGAAHWAVSGLVCVNQHLCEHVVQGDHLFTRLCVIPSGVPIPHSLSTQHGSLQIAYAGRLVQEAKRIIELVEALGLALEMNPAASATIFGDGPERGSLESMLVERGLHNRVHLAGPVSSHRIQDLLVEHHVFVLLSDYEGTPGALMDAMACGLVPVCLDIPGGVRDLVLHERTGLLVSDRGPSFLAAIDRLARDDELRKRLGANAREHIINNFSLKVAADRWEKFFDELLEDAGPRRPIQFPRRFDLPPVNPALAREDVRRPALHSRVWRRSLRLAGRTVRYLVKR